MGNDEEATTKKQRRSSTNIAIAAPSRKLVKKVDDILRQNRPRRADRLIVTLDLEFAKVTTDEGNVQAIAKLFLALKNDRLKEYKDTQVYLEKAKAFLKSKAGTDWIKEQLQPYKPTEGSSNSSNNPVVRVPQAAEHVTRTTLPTSTKAGDKRGISGVVVVEQLVQQHATTAGNVNANMVDTGQTHDSGGTNANKAIRGPFNQLRLRLEKVNRVSKKDEPHQIMGSSSGIPTLTTTQVSSGGRLTTIMAAPASSPTMLTLPELTPHQWRRRASEGQMIMPCIRCGTFHPDPMMFGYLPQFPINPAQMRWVPGPINSENQQKSFLHKSWMKYGLVMALLLCQSLIFLMYFLFGRANNKIR